MSSGLVLRAPLPEDASAFTPLKPVTMSGEPGEDASVFEDIKPPARALDNPPDLAQVRRRPAELAPAQVLLEPPAQGRSLRAFGLNSPSLFDYYYFFFTMIVACLRLNSFFTRFSALWPLVLSPPQL